LGGRLEVTAIGSETGAVVDVQGPDPSKLPDSLPAGSKFTITATLEKVKRDEKGKIAVTVTLFKRPKPSNKEQATAPPTPNEILASGTLKLEGAKETLELTLKEGANKNEIAIAVSASSSVPTPTLTEWGLIALAVLLAGGMGYMIYRRRPALRPAAP
jgi:hypothetical protein